MFIQYPKQDLDLNIRPGIEVNSKKIDWKSSLIHIEHTVTRVGICFLFHLPKSTNSNFVSRDHASFSCLVMSHKKNGQS